MTDKVQERLIELLSDGKFHSGQALGVALGITRAAISKRVSRLKDEWGICCHAVSGKGYKLGNPIGLLDKICLLKNITASEYVDQLEVYKSLNSTNDYLLQIDAPKIGKINVCVTEYQTQGKGRRGRQWLSPFGQNIYMSLCTTLQIPMFQLSGLSLAIGIALVRQLEQLGFSGLELKWPNDILYRGKKLGGILVEVKGESDGPVYVVVGIGLNVSAEELPDHFEQNAISSLSELNGSASINRNSLVAKIIDRLSQTLLAYPECGLDECDRYWSKYDAYKNKMVTLSNTSKSITGICKGINPDGALLLEVNGVLQAFSGGELSLRAVS